MRLWFKKLTVPDSNATKEVDAVQLWYVRWRAVRSILSSFYEDERIVEAFPSEQEAQEFAASLQQAEKLLRRTAHDGITITKN